MTDKTKEFLQKLKDSGRWNDEYDYSKVEYVNATTKVIIIDKNFGTKHLIQPNSILNGTKCCGTNLMGGYLTYEDAIKFVHPLNIPNQKAWYAWTKDKPHFIPSCPDKVYKNSGWVSLSEWLGTNTVATQNRKFRDFESARGYIRDFNFTNRGEYLDWSKTDDRPHDIPVAPDRVYRDLGWDTWGDFLGSNNLGPNGHQFMQFTDARDYVRSLNLRSSSEYLDWSKTDDRPHDIPATPDKVYRGDWLGYGDWLGTNVVAPQNRKFRDFKSARDYVKGLKLKSHLEWVYWCKSSMRPDDIPSNPVTKYQDFWVSWGDWLGTTNTDPQNREYLPFDVAKSYARSLNLKSSSEWYVVYKDADDLPRNADQVYKIEGWISWADFLGYLGNGQHSWTKSYILNYIKSLQTELTNLDPVELITIINSNNLAKKIRELGSLEDLLSTQAGTADRERIVEHLIEELEGANEDDFADEPTDNTPEEVVVVEGDGSDITEEVEEEQPTLEPLTPIEGLHMLDNNMVTASLDDENVDFLMKNNLKKIWNSVLNNELKVEDLQKETGGENFTIMKDKFFSEYNEVVKIKPPTDYIFQYEPNLMQKLMSYRLIKEKRYGNWSGTGAGKTLSAILAGRLAGAKNTLIIGNNATVEGWVNSIHEYFTNNNVYTKTRLSTTPSSMYTIANPDTLRFGDGNNYLVLNYETFQLGDGDYIVSELLNNNTIDYIVLDEIQNVKQRFDDTQSARRDVVNKLIIHSAEKNEELLVMGMSATPIINNLTEPKKLIELMTGEAHNELETDGNITNGIEMYKALTRYGLRYKPKYGISVNEEFIEVDGTHLHDQILNTPRGQVIDAERVLLETKLDAIKDKVKKGTLIYTHYVTELSGYIGHYIAELGFKVGYYTGEDKTGLRGFLNGTVDVLIGSAPISTGVDGIQKVCDTLIPLVLPWTSAEYDQLVGRVNRQGTNFDKVNIYIPQVVIPLGDEGIWSWDRRRFNIIRFKATLADLAIDGRIPRDLLPPKGQLLEQAKTELKEWVERLTNDDIITYEREELTIPLNPVQLNRTRNRLGDFSEMNKTWSVSRSDTTHDRLKKDPTEWYYYHTLYAESRKGWAEVPFKEIAKKLNGRPDWVVGDFGCGENLLAKEVTNKVHGFDHVAIDDSVVSCDITNVPLEDSVLDVAVFSLSLMGTNYKDYFKEAYRTLKPYGNIFVCEPAGKWEGREEQLRSELESVGFKCFGAIRNTDKFIYVDGIKY